jgi:hypothetical protein
MIRKPTWITLALFALLLVIAIFWPQLHPEESTPETTQTVEPLWDYPSSDLVGIKVENYAEEKTIEFQKDAEDQWMQITPSEAQADGELIEEVISWLASPTVERELPADNGQAQYGLDEPTGIITVTFKDGTTRVLQVGDETVVGSTRYVMMPDEDRILLIDKTDVNSVLEMVDGDWLLPPPPEEIEPESTKTLVP